MISVKITAIRKASYPDLMARYENKLDMPCSIEEGAVFWSYEAQMPEGFCPSAWETLQPFVEELAHGGGNFFDGWMKNPRSAFLSCNDGFRPVSFLIEAQ